MKLLQESFIENLCLWMFRISPNKFWDLTLPLSDIRQQLQTMIVQVLFHN